MFENFKFKPFKHYSSDKRKLSRKKHNLDLAKSDFYPPEGHSCTSLLAVQGQAQSDDTKKYFYVHGGARRTEEATWFSASDLYVIEIECDEDDVDMTSVTKATINGASLPPLQGGSIIALNFTPGSTELKGQLIIWGGLNTRTMEPSNELITLDPVKRKNTYLAKIWKSAPCDQEYPFLQTGSTPSPRSGHTLTCVPETRFAILFGGLQLPNRHSKSFTQNRFGQTCKDDSLYLLDVLSKTWKVLDCPGIGERTYHSASLIGQNTLAVLGGVKYEDFTPVKRYDISTINLITLDFEKCSGQVQIFKIKVDIPIKVSYHSLIVLDRFICVYGRYYNEGSDIRKPSQSSNLYLIDTSDWTCQCICAPDEFASAGLSLLTVDDTCLMILGGTNKQINMWTSKPLIPSPCDYQEQCNIMESSEISPIAWIQCDGACKRWLHQFCAGITTVPTKQFICKECSNEHAKRKRRKK